MPMAIRFSQYLPPMKKFLFLSCLIIFTSVYVKGQDASWSVDTTVIRLGEPITVQFKAIVDADSTPRFPDYSPWENQSFVVISNDTIFSKPRRGRKEMQQTVIVTSFDTGFAVLEPINWSYGEVDFESDPYMIEIQWVMIEEGIDLFDIKDVLGVPYPWYVYVILILLVVLLFVGILKLLKWYRRPKLPPIEVEQQTPYDWAIERLQHLETSNLWATEKYGLFFLELTTILRQYMERAHGVRAMEATIDELLKRIDDLSLSDEQLLAVSEFLKRSELIKYAKQLPKRSSSAHYINEVKTFLNWLNKPVRDV